MAGGRERLQVNVVSDNVLKLWFEDWKHTMLFWAPLGFAFPRYAAEFSHVPKHPVLPMGGWDGKPYRKART